MGKEFFHSKRKNEIRNDLKEPKQKRQDFLLTKDDLLTALNTI